MASFVNVLVCAAAALLLYTCMGVPLAVRAAPRPVALMLAPALGWAVHTPLALLLFYAVEMSRLAVAAMFAVPAVVALAAAAIDRPLFGKEWRLGALSIGALAAALLLALAVASAVLPKFWFDGVALASPIFDHSKVAMVNEIARLGVPPANPFFGEGGDRLSYYYLWHFSAAELSLLTGMSGWEADAGLSWFTALSSLTLMVGLASWLGGSPASAMWVVLLSATGSLRPLLNWLAGVSTVESFAGYQSGFAGWLFQTSWAPQHMASAMCAVLAIFLLSELARRPALPLAVMCALVMAASFESSTWIGGIVLPPAAGIVTLFAIERCEPVNRRRFILCAGITALLALAVVSPLLYDQLRLAAFRADGSPLTLAPYDVLTGRPDGLIYTAANLAAYWLLFLPVEFPAFYLSGIVAVTVLLLSRRRAAGRNSAVEAFALLLAVSLCVSWLLVSTLGENNDLGWRAVLPAVLLLILFSALALSRWLERPVSLAAVPALALVLLALPDGLKLMYGNVVGAPNASARIFETTPALWQAVRRHASSRERVANNPAFLEYMTPWPVNISWALLADRRSCYAGPALVEPFSAVSHARGNLIKAQFEHVFAGDADPADIVQLATQYNCSVAVLTPHDGAWSRDPFAASPYYRLVEDAPSWRIYKLTSHAGELGPQARFR